MSNESSVFNNRLIFKRVPQGLPLPGKDLDIEGHIFHIEHPPTGGVSLKNNYISLDPYLRTRMQDKSVSSYVPMFSEGRPITATAISTVLKSDNPLFSPGDIIRSDNCDFAEYCYKNEAGLESAIKLDPHSNLDIRNYLGALGMPGLTAYGSLMEFANLKPGETIFVSSAAGAVGQMVGQIAKVIGAKVIGSVGSDKKLAFITKKLGFDAGFNYKSEKPADVLKRLAPEGIDVYYDNVGGEHLEAALEASKIGARVIVCGMISEYNKNIMEADNMNSCYPIRNLHNVLFKRLTIRGFIVIDEDVGPKYAKEHIESVSRWIQEGKISPKLHITRGIQEAPQALIDLFLGNNFGKSVLEVFPIDI